MEKMFENLSCEQLEELEEAREIGRELIKGIKQVLTQPAGLQGLAVREANDQPSDWDVKPTVKEKIAEWKKLAEDTKNAEKTEV